MPADPVRMHEYHDVREVVVVVNEVGEVDHCFMALVEGRVEGGVGVVDDVDEGFYINELGGDPVGIFPLQPGDDQGP